MVVEYLMLLLLFLHVLWNVCMYECIYEMRMWTELL